MARNPADFRRAPGEYPAHRHRFKQDVSRVSLAKRVREALQVLGYNQVASVRQGGCRGRAGFHRQWKCRVNSWTG